MKFMLLIYAPEEAYGPGEREACYDESLALTHDLNRAGKYLHASPLQPVVTAKSLRVRNGQTFVTDGPFAETREQLGGYYLVDAKDEQEPSKLPPGFPGRE